METVSGELQVNRICQSCGESFDDAGRLARLDVLMLKAHKQEFTRCMECADELFRGKIKTQRARIFPSGGGCPLEPNETDSSMWQDNAIRDMEDG